VCADQLHSYQVDMSSRLGSLKCEIRTKWRLASAITCLGADGELKETIFRCSQTVSLCLTKLGK
jgi:hypothetical protein